MNAKRILAGVAAAPVVALGVAADPAEAGAAAQKIDQCKTLDEPGAYEVNRNLTATGDCLVVAADFATIDLFGFVLIGDGTGEGITDGGVAREGIVIRNGTVTGFRDGIDLDSSRDGQIERVRAIDNTSRGIRAGHGSTLTGNTAQGNGSTGIGGGVGCTVTGNTARDNAGSGIACSGGCTLSGDTSRDNGGDGIGVGFGSTVSGNTAQGNTGDGIQAACPSNVIGNTATANSGDDLNLTGGGGCGNTNNVTD
jgi:hypothetical protein